MSATKLELKLERDMDRELGEDGFPSASSKLKPQPISAEFSGSAKDGW